jgi:phosphoribosylformylglycinamidine cyclo-ligase
VGTKLMLAFQLDKHDTVGIDCVAMSVNDVICAGARPLFFLDYIACGKNVPERIADIVAGVAEGCVQAGCALIGGETAEMPGFYPADAYDLAGFCVGVVDRDKIIDRNRMRPGDQIIALKSTGVHSNGFSLVRKVFADWDMAAPRPELGGATLGDALIKPTAIYARPILALLSEVEAKGISHITGGGFYENVPRTIPDGLCARIEKSAIQTPPLFDLIAAAGDIPARDMFNTFNMGVGMCVVVGSEDAGRAVSILNAAGAEAYVMGEIVRADVKIALI